MQLNNKVIVAAAGAGKTWGICQEVIKEAKNTKKKILITTYTNKGVESIETEYKKQNFGVIDENVVILTWFQFLLYELVKPYQRSITNEYNAIKSIDFNHQYGFINYVKRGTKKHYITSNNDILSNTVSEFAIDNNVKTHGKVIARLEEIYSRIYIDEIQDLVGEDLELLKLLFDSKIYVECVGDYKQATYTTHNSKKNKKQSGQNIIDYFRELEKENIIELHCNKKTRRFGKEICNFSNSIFADLKDTIESDVYYEQENMGVYLIERKDVGIYYNTYKPTVLKYDVKTRDIPFSSLNFGQCKGMTFDRVLIYPNGAYTKFLKNNQVLKSPCKYYVSATRAKYSIAFVVDKVYESDNFKYTNITVGDDEIRVSKYMC